MGDKEEVFEKVENEMEEMFASSVSESEKTVDTSATADDDVDEKVTKKKRGGRKTKLEKEKDTVVKPEKKEVKTDPKKDSKTPAPGREITKRQSSQNASLK